MPFDLTTAPPPVAKAAAVRLTVAETGVPAMLFGVAMIVLGYLGLMLAAHAGDGYSHFAGFAFAAFSLALSARYYTRRR